MEGKLIFQISWVLKIRNRFVAFSFEHRLKKLEK
jgi:hypothetical protein